MANATVNPTCYHISASSIAAFKDCPTRFRLSYREGLRLIEDTESQRMGTNWHAMHEVYADCLGGVPDLINLEGMRERAMNAVIEHLTAAYGNVPNGKTAEEWALEREILLCSFIGYQWYYQNDPIEFLVSELPFELPLHGAKTGLPLPTSEVVRVGKIDHVVRWQGAVCALERKSTSRTIDPESDYWDKARKDTQVSMYALAFRDMNLASYRLGGLHLNPGERFGNTLYDVWHKPTIKPAMLTQKDTAAFVETGEYFGVKFNVEVTPTEPPHECPSASSVYVNGTPATIEQGKKGYAIRETVPMYGARLLNDIYERPEFYFQRREIVRTDQDLRNFRKQLFAVYQNMKTAERLDAWVENEKQCRATYRCPYIPVCYGPGADSVCDGRTTPAGFKRIFVDLTVNGEPVED